MAFKVSFNKILHCCHPGLENCTRPLVFTSVSAAGKVNILIFLVKIKFSPCMPINFVMQGKCLFSDISRPVIMTLLVPAESVM